MIEINLLPSGATRRPAAARRPGGGGGPSLPSLGADPRVAGMAGLGVLLLLFGAYWFWNSGKTRDDLAAQVESAAADSVRLERAIALMKTLDTRRDTIDQKMDVIRQVDTRRYVWPHVLDEVSRATPPYLWLTKLAAVEEEAAPPPPPPAAEKSKAKGKGKDKDKDKAAEDSAAAAPAAPVRPAGPVFNVEGHAGATARRPKRPELYVLCDVSTSVTSASVFFLSVLHALHDTFRKMRSFVFVERISEVTEVFERERSFRAVSDAISKDAGVADVSGYTDYGRVWREFLAQVADDLHPRATVIVLGDARTNGRDPRADVFASIVALAGRTFWLNPEPRLYWNYGDSVISAYEQHCEAHECWTTRQLEDFVKALTRPYA